MSTALITGTGRGFGAALKTIFTQNGWSVISLDRPAYDLAASATWADAAMSRIDVQDRVILISNAASLHIAPVADLTPLDIQREIAVNVTGPIILIRAFLSAHARGEVINISSSVTASEVREWSLYSTAKAAMERFVIALKTEGYQASNFDPGGIDTDLQRHIRATNFSEQSRFNRLKMSGRLRPASEVAERLFASTSADLTTR